MDIKAQINNDPAYQKFLFALEQEVQRKWRGNLKALYKDAKISKSYFSAIQNLKRKASFKVQTSIANACGFTYDEFLNYGKSEPKTKDPPPPEPDTGEIKQLERKLIAVYEKLDAVRDENTKLRQRIADLEAQRLGEPTGPNALRNGTVF